MESSRRNQVVLAGLAVVLAGLVYRQFSSTTGGAPAAAGGPRDSRQPSAPAQPAALAVHLNALQGDRPKPGDAERNLFQFKPKRPAPVERPAAPPPRPPDVAPAPAPPPSAQGPPPISLKFIGTVEAPGRGVKVAAMSDQFGVYYGGEGDTILGQYKILRIGAESIDISYLDGRGRQTIRLGGS